MRGLLPLLSFAIVAAAAVSCANGAPVQESAGGGATTGPHTGTLGQAPDAGPRGCGVAADDPNCNACLEGRCCTEAQDCAGDTTCLGCLGQPVTSEECGLNPSFQALRQCLEARCGEPCMLAGSSSSSSGGAGGAPSSSSSASSASSTTSSSTSASTSSSTSASTSSSTSASSTSSGSSSSGSSTSSGSTSSSSGGPVTCNDVDGAIGCCDAQGILHFCDTQQEVVDQVCNPGFVCGWTTIYGWYDCVPPPAGADPSNSYPMACGF